MGRSLLGSGARFFAAAIVAGCGIGQSSAAVLYSANFNSAGDSAGWNINKAGATAASPNNVPVAADRQGAAFGWNYSALGIPPAPGNAAGDTFGLRLAANVSGGAGAALGGGGTPNSNRVTGTVSGLSVSPTGQNFGTNYRLTFYAWANTFGTGGAAPGANVGLVNNAGSQGGTFNVLASVGTSGTVPNVVGWNAANGGAVATGNVMDGVAFVTTNDGGIAEDNRVYPKSDTWSAPSTGVYAAGTTVAAQGNNDAYYTSKPTFGSYAEPGGQQAIATSEGMAASPAVAATVYNNAMSGATQAGAFGMTWRKVVIEKNAGIITWKVDDVLFATLDANSLTLGGANIALGQSDVNNSSARFPSLAFTVFDNLVVESIVPEPSTLGLAAIGLIGMAVSRRRRVA